jgi:AraC family transcriptional regulator of adaptative response/methylated-DNA-[protein]-cysteine methyltransferase
MEREQAPSEVVRRLMDAVEKAPTGKLRDADLCTLGVDPSTARRQFKRAFGMTFHAYHRARRMGMALTEIRQGRAVIDSQLDRGFESASGFWEAFKRVFGQPPSKAEAANCLFARWIPTPLGAMVALAGPKGLSLLDFVDRRGLENQILSLRRRSKCAIVPGNSPHLERIARQLKAYFDGTSLTFDVPVQPAGSSFQLAVWKALRGIPPGKTRSYAELAESLGRPGAARAVGRANGRNYLALVIPCHRVIRADGELCGYGGGIWRKQWLLEHERGCAGKGK